MRQDRARASSTFQGTVELLAGAYEILYISSMQWDVGYELFSGSFVVG